MTVGDASVAVLARAKHRAEAFDAARWAIDTIKHSVAIWKDEHYADGRVHFQDGVPLEDLSI